MARSFLAALLPRQLGSSAAPNPRSAPAPAPPPSSLTEAQLASLPTHCAVATSGEEEEPECAICFEELAPGEALLALPACSHAFHAACARAWLQRCSLCPLCRTQVVIAVTAVPRCAPLDSSTGVR